MNKSSERPSIEPTVREKVFSIIGETPGNPYELKDKKRNIGDSPDPDVPALGSEEGLIYYVQMSGRLVTSENIEELREKGSLTKELLKNLEDSGCTTLAVSKSIKKAGGIQEYINSLEK